MKPYPPNKRRRFPEHRRGNLPPNLPRRGRGRGRSSGSPVVDTSQIEERGTPGPNTLSVAVLGCCHGELGAVYDRIRNHEQQTGRKVDLLLCCGDFQSLRTWEDFHSLAVPSKYRTSLGSFLPYYVGEKEAPLPTLVIGGNHEASQSLQELYYGGWLAPKIFYMGAAGVVRYRGLRIAGLSGIFKGYSFRKPHWERPPYDPSSSLRSVYHVRHVDVARLKSLSPPIAGDSKIVLGRRIDIMLSHDWPRGIEQFGNVHSLMRQKPFFRGDIEKNELGNPAGFEIMEVLKPRYWFAAHLHVQFEATVPYQKSCRSTKQSPVDLTPSQVIKAPSVPSQTETDGKQESTTQFLAVDSSDPCSPPDLTEQMTKFLALDKCLPRKPYLSILHIPLADDDISKEAGEPELEYDAEWLTILKKTHNWTCDNTSIQSITLSASDVEETIQQLPTLSIPEAFSPTLPLLPSSASIEPIPNSLPPPLPQMGNPQTDSLLQMLGLNHCKSGLTIPFETNIYPSDTGVAMDPDENEIDLDDI